MDHTLLLANGRVRTMGSSPSEARAIAIRGSRITWVGDDPPDDAVTVDLGGRCVVPGFTDAHVHFMRWALAQHQVRLEGARTADEVVDRVRAALPDIGPDGWLLGHGWRELEWTPRTEPNRALLDAVSDSVPIALRSKDAHALWLNSAALARADGWFSQRRDVIHLDPDGRPTGLLQEEAARAFERRFIRLSTAQRDAAVRAGIEVAHRRGVTSVHDVDGDVRSLESWQRLRDDDGLSLRVWQSFPHERLPELRRLGLRGGLGDGSLKVGYLKLFMDGSLGSRTASMLDGSGVSILNPDDVEDVIRDATEAGWDVAIHAIGNRANRQALDALDATRSVWAASGRRPRIEHVQLVSAQDVARFASIGVACSVQFSHAPSDRDLVDEVWADVAADAYPFRSLWDSGALVVNGSDAPIEELDPMLGIRAAVCRTLDDRPGWRMEQALTVEQAIRASTVNPPWLSRDERRRGRLLPGMDADLVILSEDPMRCRAEELQRIEVVATMVAGRWVHGGASLG